MKDRYNSVLDQHEVSHSMGALPARKSNRVKYMLVPKGPYLDFPKTNVLGKTKKADELDSLGSMRLSKSGNSPPDLHLFPKDIPVSPSPRRKRKKRIRPMKRMENRIVPTKPALGSFSSSGLQIVGNGNDEDFFARHRSPIRTPKGKGEADDNPFLPKCSPLPSSPQRTPGPPCTAPLRSVAQFVLELPTSINASPPALILSDPGKSYRGPKRKIRIFTPSSPEMPATPGSPLIARAMAGPRGLFKSPEAANSHQGQFARQHSIEGALPHLVSSPIRTSKLLIKPVHRPQELGPLSIIGMDTARSKPIPVLLESVAKAKPQESVPRRRVRSATVVRKSLRDTPVKVQEQISPRTRSINYAAKNRLMQKMRSAAFSVRDSVKGRLSAKKGERATAQIAKAIMQKSEWDYWRNKWWGGKGHREGAWRTVRVFISSTFRDFHGERDVLTRQVFPLLNQRIRKRHVRAVPVDLRWGLTSEDTSDSGLGALELCLLEVENTRPFFVMLMGERYGWIPPHYKVSERPELRWVKDLEPGHSITAVEVLHGFLRHRHRPVHAYAYHRDPGFTKTISVEEEREIFDFDYRGAEDEDVIFKRREKLREDIMTHPFCSYKKYTGAYGGKDGEGKPYVSHLERFAAMVLEDLETAIKTEFPEAPVPMTPLEFERSFHELFLHETSRNFVGRIGMLEALHSALSKNPIQFPQVPIVVAGEPGSGKTSLVTYFASTLQQRSSKDDVIVHVVGASPTSTNIRMVLLRLTQEIQELYSLLDVNTSAQQDYGEVKNAFHAALAFGGAKAITRGRRLLVFVDAINQLSPFYNAWSMDWIPAEAPRGTRIVLSTVLHTDEYENAGCLDNMTLRPIPPDVIDVKGLTVAERKEIVVKRLGEYGKRLEAAQLDLMIEKTDSDKPLFLLTCCEELRLQAQYGQRGEGVFQLIESLPGKILDLLDVVLNRVERDMEEWARTSSQLEAGGLTGALLVRDALTLLETSRHGLRESELLELLHLPGKDRLPTAAWTRLYRGLELYLRPQGDEETNLLGFFHRQLKFAVQQRYYRNSKDFSRSTAFVRLMDYFWEKGDPSGTGRWDGKSTRALNDIVWYQLQSQHFLALHKTLCSITFVQARAELGARSMEGLLRDYLEAQISLQQVRKIQQVRVRGERRPSDLRIQFKQLKGMLREFRVFVSQHHTSLLANPELTMQFALNQPNSTYPYRAARRLIDDTVASDLAWLENNFPSEIRRQLPQKSTQPEEATPIPTAPQRRVFRQQSLRATNHDFGLIPTPAPIKSLKQVFSFEKTAPALIDRRWFDWKNKPDENALVAEYVCFDKEVVCSDVSPNEKTIAIGCSDGVLLMMKMETGQLEREFIDGHQDCVMCLQFSPLGNRLLSGGKDGQLMLWDVHTGAKLLVLPAHHQFVTAVKWRPIPLRQGGFDGFPFVSTSWDSSIKFWLERKTDPGSPPEYEQCLKPRFDGLRSPIVSLCFLPNGDRLLAGCQDGTVLVYDASVPTLGELVELSKLQHPDGIVAKVITLAYCPLRKCFAAGVSLCAGPNESSNILLWTETTSNSWTPQRLTTKSHEQDVSDVDFSPDGSRLLSASVDKTLVLWDMDTNGEICVYRGHSMSISSCRFVQDGEQIVSTSLDKTVKVWSTASAAVSGKTAEDMDEQEAANPCVVVAGRLGRRRRNSIVRARGEDPLALMKTVARGMHAGAIHVMRFSPSGRLVYSGGEDLEVKVWDADTGSLKGVLIGHGEPITVIEVFLLPTETRECLIATGSRDGTLMVRCGSCFRGTDWWLQLWEDIRGQPTMGFKHVNTITPHRAAVTAVCVMADCERGVTGGSDGTLRVLNLESGRMEPEDGLFRHDGAVLALYGDLKDQRRVLSFGADGILRIWDLTTVSLVRMDTVFDLFPVPGQQQLAGRFSADGAILWVSISLQSRAPEPRSPARTPSTKVDDLPTQRSYGPMIQGQQHPTLISFLIKRHRAEYLLTSALDIPPVELLSDSNANMGASVGLVASDVKGQFVVMAPHGRTAALGKFGGFEEVAAPMFRTDADLAPPPPKLRLRSSKKRGNLSARRASESVDVKRPASDSEREPISFTPMAAFCTMGNIECVSVSPDGENVAIGDTAGRLYLLKIVDGEEKRKEFSCSSRFCDDDRCELKEAEEDEEDKEDAVVQVSELDIVRCTLSGADAPCKILHSPTLPSALDGARSLKLGQSILNAYRLRPKSLLMTFGGAGGLHAMLLPGLRARVMMAVQTAMDLGALVIDGGTDSGVMKMVGSAMSLQSKSSLSPEMRRGNLRRNMSARPIRRTSEASPAMTRRSVAGSSVPGGGRSKASVKLLGVAPAGLVLYPGSSHPVGNEEEACALEPNHSHFVLAPSSDWGGETTTMFVIVKALQFQHEARFSAPLPAIGLLANGGQISKQEVLAAVTHGVPMIVLEGSGRLADTISNLYHCLVEGFGDVGAAELSLAADDMLKTIMDVGNLHIVSILAGNADDEIKRIIMKQFGKPTNI